jgi:hypothetical protein
MATATKNCIFYFVQLSETGEPIPETMVSRPTNRIPRDLQCVWARVPKTQMTRTGQCFPASGFRYYYKVDRNGNILSNSMYQTQSKPSTWCDGTYNILEFVVYKTDTE